MRGLLLSLLTGVELDTLTVGLAAGYNVTRPGRIIPECPCAMHFPYASLLILDSGPMSNSARQAGGSCRVSRSADDYDCKQGYNIRSLIGLQGKELKAYHDSAVRIMAVKLVRASTEYDK